MSDPTETTETTEPEGPTELDLLKKRAKMMGISHHPSIGADTLRNKLDTALAFNTEADTQELEEEAIVEPQTPAPATKATMPIKRKAKTAKQLKNERHQRLRKESARMIRIHVTCMNPNKKGWEGEMYTVSNSVVGTFKKFVPFNNPEGWHVPMIIYKMMKERECQIFQTVKGEKGRKVKRGKIIKELAIEIMDPLTRTEMSELAIRQARANTVGKDD